MSPYLFERLYNHWGQPRWFWPAVMFVLFVVLPGVAGALDGALQ